jgi:hypothetical protein
MNQQNSPASCVANATSVWSLVSPSARAIFCGLPEMSLPVRDVLGAKLGRERPFGMNEPFWLCHISSKHPIQFGQPKELSRPDGGVCGKVAVTRQACRSRHVPRVSLERFSVSVRMRVIGSPRPVRRLPSATLPRHAGTASSALVWGLVTE